MYKITFKIENSEEVVSYASAGESLLEAARNASVDIDAPCSGNGVCGKCRVTLLDGAVQSSQSRHLTEEEFDRGIRLACESRVCADAVIGVPQIAVAFKTDIRTADMTSQKEIDIFTQAQKTLSSVGIGLTESVFAVSVKLDEPTLNDTMPDNERLIRAVSELIGSKAIFLSTHSLIKLSKILRDNSFEIKCIIKKDDNRYQIIDILDKDDKSPVCGVAIDIGTTTVSAVLVDLNNGDILSKASCGNAQIKFGADVINRIIASCREGGSERLQKAIVDETVKPLVHRLCDSIEISSERVYRLSIAANTTMNHLFAGVYADPVRMEPYIPSFFETDCFHGHDFNLGINGDADIVIAPNTGSYVGGDITAGTLVSMIWNDQNFSLFVDLGTNGEIVFGNSDFLMSCACSAGPAFEGGDMSCGMRATLGAIESCKIDPETMEPELGVIGDVRAVGICGSGIIDTVSELFRCGIIDAKGQFSRKGERVEFDENGLGKYILVPLDFEGGEVSITEVDIANFIRAKGAIFSAIKTMLSSLDMDVSVIGNIYIAGGIGSGINLRNAVSIGMLPDIDSECYHYIGNTSLAGAYSMLVSEKAEEKVHEIARSMTYLELSAEPDYMGEFVAACFIPHTDKSLFPSLGL